MEYIWNIYEISWTMVEAMKNIINTNIDYYTSERK
jgi:hypothetical protein